MMIFACLNPWGAVVNLRKDMDGAGVTRFCKLIRSEAAPRGLWLGVDKAFHGRLGLKVKRASFSSRGAEFLHGCT